MLQILSDGLVILGENKLIVFGSIILLFLGYSAITKEIKKTVLGLLALFFLFSVLLRLAFLKDIFVPPYFDSVEHLRIIKALVDGFNSAALPDRLPELPSNYYHLGFHFLASLLTLVLRADPISVVLVFGQIILASIPIPIFFLLWYTTKNNTAAFFALLLAGFGWYMPGFAINWGKYPALAGLLAFEIVLSLAYASSQRKTKQNQSASIIFFILGILISTLIHSRIFIVFLIFFMSWSFAKTINHIDKSYKPQLLRVHLLGIVILGILIQNDSLLKLTLEPYLNKGILITLIVLLLSPFALKKFPREFYFSVLFILYTLACLFIPTGKILPGYTNQTLLDRPFVEMLLFFPLSLLGGLGLAGFLQIIEKIQPFSKKLYRYTRILILFLVIGVIGFFSIKNYTFYPANCCNFVGYDDTIIFDWIDKNLASDAHILVASNPLNVMPSSTSESFVGSDAGIWISQLLHRKTTLMPYQTDFLSSDTKENLCQLKVDYIYIGNSSQSFKVAQLNTRTAWYEKILILPNAQLYQLNGCFTKNLVLPLFVVMTFNR